MFLCLNKLRSGGCGTQEQLLDNPDNDSDTGRIKSGGGGEKISLVLACLAEAAVNGDR